MTLTSLNEATHSNEDQDKFILVVQYRGQVTDELTQKLHQMQCSMPHTYDIKKTEIYDGLFENPCDD